MGGLLGAQFLTGFVSARLNRGREVVVGLMLLLKYFAARTGRLFDTGWLESSIFQVVGQFEDQGRFPMDLELCRNAHVSEKSVAPAALASWRAAASAARFDSSL